MIDPITTLTGIFAPAGPAAVGRPAGPATVAPSAAAQPLDFSKVMAQVATDAVDTLKAGETMAITGIQGKASTQQVVEAVMAAERALQTAIAVRDKVVAAYQEVSRMAI